MERRGKRKVYQESSQGGKNRNSGLWIPIYTKRAFRCVRENRK